MKKEKLKILFKKVGQEPKVKFIDNTLKAKQKLVGGLIEVISFKDDTLIICNEEGKFLDLPANTIFDIDYIAGNYFVVGDDFENADFKSLTDEQIKNILPIINENSVKYSDKQFKDFIKDYENEFLEKLDNESNEHLAEDYKEKDFEC